MCETIYLLLIKKVIMVKREERFARLIAKKLSQGEKISYMSIACKARKSGLNIKELVKELIGQCKFLGISEMPAIAAFLDDAAKKAAGFKSKDEYLEYLTEKKGFKSMYDKRKFDAGTRFVSIVRSLEELGMPTKLAVAEAERVIKFPTKRRRKRALEMLEKARKKGV